MVRLTLLELNLDGADFTANAPFSGTKRRSGIGESIGRRFESGDEGDDDAGSESGRSQFEVLIGLALIGGAIALARRLQSKRHEGDAPEVADPIVAD